MQAPITTNTDAMSDEEMRELIGEDGFAAYKAELDAYEQDMRQALMAVGGSKKFYEDSQPRDDHGRWTDSGGGEWTKVGSKQGSNDGGTYLSPDGIKHYVKFYANEQQAHTEVAAQTIYEHVGVSTLGNRLEQINGKTAVVHPFSDLSPLSADSMKAAFNADPKFAGALMAASVATQNWDVVGTGWDNLMRAPDGKLVEVDTGGSFLFRAQGGPKNYTTTADELNTLQSDKINSYAAHVFKDVMQTPEARSAAIAAAAKISASADKLAPGTGVSAAQIRAKMEDFTKQLAPPKPDVVFNGAKFDGVVEVKSQYLDANQSKYYEDVMRKYAGAFPKDVRDNVARITVEAALKPGVAGNTDMNPFQKGQIQIGTNYTHDPSEGRMSPEWVISHEMGHALLQRLADNDPKTYWTDPKTGEVVLDKAGNPARSSKGNWLKQNVSAAAVEEMKNVSMYARSDSNEAFAEAVGMYVSTGRAPGPHTEVLFRKLGLKTVGYKGSPHAAKLDVTVKGVLTRNKVPLAASN